MSREMYLILIQRQGGRAHEALSHLAVVTYALGAVAAALCFFGAGVGP